MRGQRNAGRTIQNCLGCRPTQPHKSNCSLMSTRNGDVPMVFAETISMPPLLDASCAQATHSTAVIPPHQSTREWTVVTLCEVGGLRAMPSGTPLQKEKQPADHAWVKSLKAARPFKRTAVGAKFVDTELELTSSWPRQSRQPSSSGDCLRMSWYCPSS